MSHLDQALAHVDKMRLESGSEKRCGSEDARGAVIQLHEGSVHIMPSSSSATASIPAVETEDLDEDQHLARVGCEVRARFLVREVKKRQFIDDLTQRQD